MSPERYLKTHCTICDGHIEFPSDAAGAEITCPHCGGKTVLKEIQPAEAKPSPNPKEQHHQHPSGLSGAKDPTGKSVALLALYIAVVALVVAAGGFLAYRALAKKSGDGADQPPGSPSAQSTQTGAPETANNLQTPAGDAATKQVKKEKASDTGKKKEGLEVARFEIQKAAKGNVVYVVGRVVNHDPAQYFKLKVEFNLFKKGMPAGQCSDRLPNLAPNGTWDFKALILEDGVDEAKVSTIDGEKE